MAGRNNETDKEMARLLEQFAKEYHEIMYREACKTMIFCTCAMVLLTFGFDGVRQAVRERNFRRMYQIKK